MLTNCYSIKCLLLQKFQEAVILYQNILGKSAPDLAKIPLNKAKDNSKILYISAIAFQLTQLWHLDSWVIANELSYYLSKTLKTSDTSQANINFFPLNFTITTFPPGWIHLQIDDITISHWLQHLLKEKLINIDKSHNFNYPFPIYSYPKNINLFDLQYTHARCCSLLRLAHQEKIITLGEANAENSLPCGYILIPNAIPWLNNQGQLQLISNPEIRLISQLIELLDILCYPTINPAINFQGIDLLNLAAAISSCFQDFYSYCSIWGEIKNKNINLALARLGLVAITQSLLYLILQKFLDIDTPLEL